MKTKFILAMALMMGAMTFTACSNDDDKNNAVSSLFLSSSLLHDVNVIAPIISAITKINFVFILTINYKLKKKSLVRYPDAD